MHDIRLGGVIPPIPTPFDVQGDVAYEQLSENIDRWNAFGLTGYVVLGSNGEAALLDSEEKRRILETARKAIPADKVMIAGTGCESTRATIALTQQAADAGADAALVVTPHYYDDKMTPDSLVRFFCKVADASPIPLVLYNVAKFTHVDMDADTIVALSHHPNVVGVKDSGGNIAKLSEIVRLATPDFQVLAGSASFFLAGLTLGAIGGVMALANIAPQPSLDIYRLFQEGRRKEAAELQRRMVPVNAAITARYGIAGLKAALDMLGYYGGPVRAPLLDLTGSEIQSLRSILVAGGLL